MRSKNDGRIGDDENPSGRAGQCMNQLEDQRADRKIVPETNPVSKRVGQVAALDESEVAA